MLKNLKKASLITLSILSGFVFTIFLAAAYILGEINIPFLILATIFFNFLMWIISPSITDVMLRIFYHMKFYEYRELHDNHPETAAFLEKVCKDNDVRFPRVGIIEDDNPTAFTYGSLPRNARMVFSRGLFTYLKQDEREAVLAHEVGHIVHYDFAVITVASTLIQILYEFYVIFSKTKSPSARKRGNILYLFIAFMSYAFYIVGTYILLYLSRLREYYADEFSAKVTGKPEILSWALVRIAYGIVAKKDDEKSHRLMESTRALGIIDVHSVKSLGLVANLSDSPEMICRVMAFDFISPWAFILELGSTHPLTGKRIQRLNELSLAMGKTGAFDIRSTVNSIPIDRIRLYHNFFLGLIINFLPQIGIAGGMLIAFLNEGSYGFIFMLLGSAMIIKAIYRFPNIDAEKATIRDLMSDIYACPIRGKKVELCGKVVGRGDSGAVLGEDMMFEDNGGLIYLDYNSNLGAIGNLFFALNKIKSLIGKPIMAEGWFFRGMGQYVSLDKINDEGSIVKSYPRLWDIIFGALLVLGGFVAVFK